MESVAAHQNQIVVPFDIFTWRRIKSMKEKNYFHFKVGRESYFILDNGILKPAEKEKLENYLMELNYKFKRSNNYKYRSAY